MRCFSFGGLSVRGRGLLGPVHRRRRVRRDVRLRLLLRGDAAERPDELPRSV